MSQALLERLKNPGVDIQNSCALVSGASRGIGQGIAVGLALDGLSLALVGRNMDALNETKRLCLEHSPNNQAKFEVFPCDLSKTDEIKALIDQVVTEMGSLDILINNAGLCYHQHIEDAQLEQWDLSVDVNLKALFHLTHHALAAIKKSQHGAILNISSVAGKRGYTKGAVYCATKYGVQGFTESLFKDLRQMGIKVCSLSPGYTNTAMNWGRGLNLEEMLQPGDIANTVRWVLKCPGNMCPVDIVLECQRDPRPSRGSKKNENQ
jgi:3-oxoacyl-[acyl-carrier protein] reductase